MANPPSGVFRGSIIVHPTVDLKLERRTIGGFEVSSSTSKRLTAESLGPDAWSRFLSKEFLAALELLAWDMVWERQVAVEFEPDSGCQGEMEIGGQQVQMMYIHDTISPSGNPRSGTKSFDGFDLLQRIRDHIIQHHIASGSDGKSSSNATLLLAVEHFVKGVVRREYAMAEFYLVVETVENWVGGRHELFRLIPKTEVDKITSFANQPQHDQRHAPKDASSVVPLSPTAVPDAALVAKNLIIEFSKQIT
jgi:hypothetical protein